MMNLNLTSLYDQKINNSFSSESLLETQFAAYRTGTSIDNICGDLEQSINTLENLCAIHEHIKVHGASEALIDLVGGTYSNEGVIIDGIKQAIRWIVEKIKKLFAAIAAWLNKVAGVKDKVVTVEKVVTKIKEVPTEVIKEKVVVKTIKEAVEKPIYIGKDEKFEFDTDIVAIIKWFESVVEPVLQSMRGGDDITDRVKAFIDKYHITRLDAFDLFDDIKKFKKQTTLSVRDLIPIIRSCGELNNIANQAMFNVKTNLDAAHRQITKLEARIAELEKNASNASEDINMLKTFKDDIKYLNAGAQLAYRTLDHIVGIVRDVSKQLEDSRLYTDK